MFFLNYFRRRALQHAGFAAAWEEILLRTMPLYRILPADGRAELHRHVPVFLAEKQFEGALGLAVTDEMRVTIAATACLLRLYRTGILFPLLSSIIIYPGEFVSRRQEVDECGIVTEGEDVRSGESWEGGALVLSWEDVCAAGQPGEDDYNVILHEFAHQLDAETGISDRLAEGPDASPLSAALLTAYDELCADVADGRETVFDPYGAESPQEFFAVATECFFGLPAMLREYHPDLYDRLRELYGVDPAGWHYS